MTSESEIYLCCCYQRHTYALQIVLVKCGVYVQFIHHLAAAQPPISTLKLSLFEQLAIRPSLSLQTPSDFAARVAESVHFYFYYHFYRFKDVAVAWTPPLSHFASSASPLKSRVCPISTTSLTRPLAISPSLLLHAHNAMAPTALAVLCGETSAALVTLATDLTTGGLRVAVLCSPVLSDALVAAKVPHVPVATPADVALLLADRIELVVAAPPAATVAGESVKSRHTRLERWVNGAYSFVRTAAWNHKQISVVVDAQDVELVRAKISTNGTLAYAVQERRALAAKAFGLFAELDQAIAASLHDDNGAWKVLG